MVVITPLEPNLRSLVAARNLARGLSEPVCRGFNLLPVALSDDEVVTIASARPRRRLPDAVAVGIGDRQVTFVTWSQAQLDRALDAVFAGPPTAHPLEALAAEVRAEADVLDASRHSDPRSPRIGEKLVGLGLITHTQVEAALHEQRRTGSRVGEILVASGVLSELELLAVLADHLRLRHVDLGDFNPDPELAELLPEQIVRRLRIVPLAADDSTLYVAVPDALGEDVLTMLAQYTHHEVKELLATRNSIDELMQRIYRDQYVQAATIELRNRAPENSADRVLSRGQRVFLIALVCLLAAGFIVAPAVTAITLVAIASVFYLASSLYKARLIYRSLGHGAYVDVTDEEIAALDERDLPIYTILVPLFHEAAVVPQLLAGIGRLDYPQTKLDIRLLCEADDHETIEAIRALDPPPHFRTVIVPESQPQTKPKACNYGLLQADGEYVVIYDAEDRAEPDQLKKAVLAFAKADEAVTCLQARLNYFNTHQNLLTRWFSIEYSMHFDLLLPGLCAVQAPIPLGGTSNHFRVDRLRELGAWDPFNVTEDADLGVRLHKAGYTTAMIDSTTLEEATSSVHNWIRQRSRWIKGYLQTWLVHMRNPFKLWRQLGTRAFISFNLIVGGAFIFLLNPIFWALTTAFLITHAAFIQTVFPAAIFYIASCMLFLGNFIFVYFNVAGSLQSGRPGLTRYALLSPLYWGLMSWAAWKGFTQLLYRPFYWEKTTHGQSTHGQEPGVGDSPGSAAPWPMEFERRESEPSLRGDRQLVQS